MRLLVVYSCWVQILTAKTTPFYIVSILEGWGDIVDKMEIHQTPWFNFLHASGQLWILLSAFENIKLEPCCVTKLRMPLKGIRSNSQLKRLKRKPKDDRWESSANDNRPYLPTRSSKTSEFLLDKCLQNLSVNAHQPCLVMIKDMAKPTSKLQKYSYGNIRGAHRMAYKRRCCTSQVRSASALEKAGLILRVLDLYEKWKSAQRQETS